jgi:phage terminase large subunit-like protein
MQTNTPSHYWGIAKEYIIEQSKYLDENEPKYYLDKKLSYNYIKFGSMIKHSSGELAGNNFQFMEWQIKAIIDIFGTKYRDGKFKGLRRYQRALFFVAKKAGKTEFGALLTLIYFFLDPEKGKECYSIASEIEQAKILHKAFTTMIRQEPDLEEMVKTTIQPPRVAKFNGAFVDEYIALSSTADSKDGLKPSMLLVDEPHTYPNKALYQIISDGLAGRREPLEIFMSTAGYNQQGFFYLDVYQYAKKLKSGVLQDETFYYVMFEPDDEDLEKEDFWKDPEVWKKSNPNLGISPTLSYMESKVNIAGNSAESLVSFKTKHLNVWCDKADVGSKIKFGLPINPY